LNLEGVKKKIGASFNHCFTVDKAMGLMIVLVKGILSAWKYQQR